MSPSHAKFSFSYAVWAIAITSFFSTLNRGIADDIAKSKQPMNIVFFLVDDLGWADLGCYGNRFNESPNIDQLAKSGMRFTNGYAACPVCSPTRASILTGRHPVRVNITDWIPGMRADRLPKRKFEHVDDRDSLALSEMTIAEVLKKKGYATFFAGKWHLGDKGHWPTDQGFDYNIGGNAKGSPPGGYYAPWKNPTLTAKDSNEYLTERLTNESVSFIEKHAGETNPDRDPFLLYLSYYNVHTPITPYKKSIERFQNKADQLFSSETPFAKERDGFSRMRHDNPAYASMLDAVDQSVGRIVKSLKDNGLDQNTAIVFFSDNGGLCTVGSQRGPTTNLPLRSGKGWLYEGGIREPMIVSVPGTTQPGSVCDAPVVSMDFFPTIMELAQLDLDPKLHCDGQSLMPLLENSQKKMEARDLFWHYPHYHGSTWKPGAAVRSGDWKLIEFYEEGKAELFNVRTDVGEKNELGQSHPEKVAELKKLLKDWQLSMGAKMPILRKPE